MRDVMLAEIRPRVREIDEHSDYPHDIHQVLAREALLGLAIEPEYGGGERRASSPARSPSNSRRCRALCR
jgi:alkylation response protein AidB-like acyl-CoA dehydrogenase